MKTLEKIYADKLLKIVEKPDSVIKEINTL